MFLRGDYRSPGEDAPVGFGSILEDSHPEPSGSGRLELAQWLTDPEHPLTARVMVNRVWQWHFGEGLVRTPSNFGKMGEAPSHPELLDFLARRFVENGWSIKDLHCRILRSSTYRMSSDITPEAYARDAENRFLSHFNRRRLAVEEIRDGLFAIDGSLDLAMGGDARRRRWDRSGEQQRAAQPRSVDHPPADGLFASPPSQFADASRIVRFRRCGELGGEAGEHERAAAGAIHDEQRLRRRARR